MNERYTKLYDSTDVKKRIGQLASEITARHDDESPLFVALLRGANPFASQLMFEITRQAPDFHPELDYMMTSRYADSVIPNSETQIVMDLAPTTEVKGRSVVIVDDVLDFMVEKAMEYKLGARGLRSICEGILTDAMYELPSSSETQFVLDLEYAKRKFDKSKLSLLKVA